MPSGARSWTTPRDRELHLRRIENRCGLAISFLPNGCVFSIERQREGGAATMVNQILGSPIDGAVGRLYLRASGGALPCLQAVGPGAKARFGAGDDFCVWEGESVGLVHRASLSLQPEDAAWLWRLEVENASAAPLSLDAVFIQDLGLGERGFLMNNEAYASQYIDHCIARRAPYGPVVMSRQNLAQGGRHPWVAHGCLEGARAYATDGRQLFGPAFRDADAFGFPFGADLPSERLQHELACVGLQSFPIVLEPGARAAWRFFGLYVDDQPVASSDADLARIEAVAWRDRPPVAIDCAAPVRSLPQDAPPVAAEPLEPDDLARRYKERSHDELANGDILSFFTPDPPHNRHVALRAKEQLMTRRHGALIRSGQAILSDGATLSATCWMHGVFAAQLTIGNTSFHKLFSVSRDPYNITRASGLRILADLGDGWRLLAVPSAFEMGLGDCRWIYRLGARVITISAIGSGAEAAMQWRVVVDGPPCRFLVFGHLALGEREFEHESLIEVEPDAKRFTFRPDPNGLWGRRCPDAVYHLVTSTPEALESIGGDELLYADGAARQGAYAAMRTHPTREFVFAVVGSMTDSATAARLAAKYQRGVDDDELLAPAAGFWSRLTRKLRIRGGGAEGSALNATLPWLAHDAMIHLSVPRGLEQYTAAAWGTRDVCQGPVEFLLALKHDEPVKEILRIVFAQQSEAGGDWPQWFMLEPYSFIRDSVSHGDVIVWPLKALNDYIEATNDLGFLDVEVAWRRADGSAATAHADPIAAHVEKLLATARGRFIPGTHLIRYGEGDWNDSLQPADPSLRDWMTSSWTVALLYQQASRYAEILRRAGRTDSAAEADVLAAAMRRDFNLHLLRDDVVAGYGLFEPGGERPELLLHPSDARTGLKYSLLPMTRAIIGGLFTPEQAARHLMLIREHLLFPDGARLIDRSVAYHGGPQRLFRRAESAAFFGREIGLMYVHAHLRYAEAMAILGDGDALWDALQSASPLAATDRLEQAAPRQRNAYFSSSDAAFQDRYLASAEWDRVKAGAVALEGGWRIYSSGPGLYVSLVVGRVFGRRRRWGQYAAEPLRPRAHDDVRLEWDVDA
jgi:cellobiose phosphorylase